MKFKDKFFQQYLPAFVAVVGFPAIFYGVWFQTLGFELVRWYFVLIVFAGSVLGGKLLIGAFEKQMQHPSTGPMTKKLGKKNMTQGLSLCFFLCLLVLYQCVSLLTFFIGLILSAFIWSSIIFYLIYDKKEKKKQE